MCEGIFYIVKFILLKFPVVNPKNSKIIPVFFFSCYAVNKKSHFY